MSRPVRTALLKQIKAAGGYGALLERVANGESIGKVAESLGVSRSFLIFTMTKNGKDKEAFNEARRLSAEAHVERATKISDEVKADRDHVQRARLQVGHLQWLASKLDRDTWGEVIAPPVQINVNTLHLDALRAAPPARIPLPTPTVSVSNGD